jgi:hypothetical protein
MPLFYIARFSCPSSDGGYLKMRGSGEEKRFILFCNGNVVTRLSARAMESTGTLCRSHWRT